MRAPPPSSPPPSPPPAVCGMSVHRMCMAEGIVECGSWRNRRYGSASLNEGASCVCVCVCIAAPRMRSSCHAPLTPSLRAGVRCGARDAV